MLTKSQIYSMLIEERITDEMIEKSKTDPQAFDEILKIEFVSEIDADLIYLLQKEKK